MLNRLWIATAGITCAVTGAASAQTSAPAPAAAAAAQTASTDTATPDSVVITANRRRQTLETVPLAVSAIAGKELAERGVFTPQDLTAALPNIQNGLAGFAIRGIASGDDTPKGDPSTAFSLDGIFIARSQIQSLAMFDIERVEVLRGPQGTLYGRNATSGAVNVITAKPVYANLGSLGLEAGNYGTLRSTLMVNRQLSDTSALRIAAATNQHDGFTPTRDGTKALDSRGDASLRVRYLTELTPDTTALVTVDYSRESDTGPAHLPVGRVLSGDASQLYQNPGSDGYYHLKSGGMTLELNSEMSIGTLTSLTGYRETTVNGIQLFNDLGNGPRGLEDWKNRQISEELRLTSKGSSPLQWVAGLFYFSESTDIVPSVAIPGFGNLAWDLKNTSSSAAAFAQATYSLKPDWRVVGGLRYTRDHKDRNGTASGDTVFGAFSSPYAADVSYGKTSWKLGVEHDLENKALAYATVSTGYKAGGFNDGNPQVTQNLYYNPENMLAVEAGLKGRFLDKKLYLSISAFSYDYRDLQLSSLPATGGITTLNAAKAKVNGLEVEGNWRLTPNGKLDFNAALLNARYSDYAPGDPPVSYAGKALDRSPKGSLRLGYSHDFMTSVGRFNANIATKYSSSYVVSDYGVPVQYTQAAFWRSDLSLTYFATDEKWSVQAFARNLEDKRQLAINRFNTFSLTDPRQIGVRYNLSF